MFQSNFKSHCKSWEELRQEGTARRPSAVALVIMEQEGLEPSLVLIRRSSRLKTHRGQIGLPGGRYETGDTTPVQTALRETHEEVGIPPDHISVMGSMEPVLGIDSTLVYPVLGKTNIKRSDLIINSSEVDEVFLVPLTQVMSSNKKKFRFNLFGCWRSSFLYDCKDVRIWGLTAEILSKCDFRI